MLSLTILTLSCLASAIPAPRPVSELKRATAEHIVKLKRIGKKAPSSRGLLSVLASDDIVELDSAGGGAGYAVEVDLSGAKYDVIFDTGSSDLWVFDSDVQCINANDDAVDNSKCDFGAKFSGDYSEGEVNDEHFYITYGDGQTIYGSLGYEKVTLGDVSVDNQEIALAERAYWAGDGETSGIFGFAPSAGTSAYPGEALTKEPFADDMTYTNWIDNAINKGKIDAKFGLALERGDNGGSGQLALGGLPDVDFNKDALVSVPILKPEINGQTSNKFIYYAMQPDGIKLDGTSESTSWAAIVDSGTTLAYFPSAIAKAINDAYDPPSQFVEDISMFVSDCDATPPDFAITIAGKDFSINAEEMILQNSLSSPPGKCLSGIQATGTDLALLGDVFLKNVIVVFDIGNEELQFAPHENY